MRRGNERDERGKVGSRESKGKRRGEYAREKERNRELGELPRSAAHPERREGNQSELGENKLPSRDR